MKRMTALWMGVFSFVLLALGVAPPVAAWSGTPSGTLNDSQEPGSVLVFYRFDAGAISTPDEGSIAKSQFKISVTCPTDLGPTGCNETGDFATGQAVFLKAHWVCPPNDSGTTCPETDFPLSTTVFGTVEFDANGGEDLPAPPCKNGYLIVWVQTDKGERISFNGLIGSAVLRGSGTSWRAYNALPIQSPQPSFTELTYITAGGGAALAFDGTEYQAITGTIYGNVAYPNSEQTRLTLLTLDVLSNQPNDVTTVGLKFYNESEFYISTAASFTCWGEFPLDKLSGGDLTGRAFSGQDGLVRSLAAEKAGAPGTPVTVVGIIETREDLTQNLLSTASETIHTALINAAGAPVTSVNPPCTFTSGSSGLTGSCQASCTPSTSNVCIGRTVTIAPTCPLGTVVTVPIVSGVSCSITTDLTDSVSLTREYAYPLLNDSIPVSTTFVPFP